MSIADPTFASAAEPGLPEPSTLRKDLLCLGLLLVLALTMWAPRLRGPIDIRFDGGVYYVLGTSLAEGKGYRLLNEPGEIESVQYPPLLPLVVAATQKLVGSSDFVIVGWYLRMWCMVASVGLTLVTYCVARVFLSPLYALGTAVLAALTMHSYYLSEVFYTEVPFALMTAIFYLCLRRADRRGYSIAAAVLAVLAYLLRSAGMALLFAWVAESLFNKRWKQAGLRTAIALAPVLFWNAHIYRVTTSDQYRHPAYPYQRAAYYYPNVTYAENIRLVDSFQPELGRTTVPQLIARVFTNLAVIPERMGETVSAGQGIWQWGFNELHNHYRLPQVPKPVPVVIVWIFGGIVLLGAVLIALRREVFLMFYLMASIGLMCLTPWPEQFIRYLMPLNAFLMTFFVVALLFLARQIRARVRGRWGNAGWVMSVIVVAACLSVELFMARKSYGAWRNRVTYYDAQGKMVTNRIFYYGKEWLELDMASDWVRHHAAPGDVVSSIMPQCTYARTGFKAVLPPMEPDVRKAQELLDSVPVKYVIVDSMGYPAVAKRYTRPTVEARPDLWKLVYESPKKDANVYERIGDAAVR